MTFRINYSQVLRQARTIKNLSDDLNREIRRLEEILTSSKNVWKGPASNAYQINLKRLVDDMKQTKYDMSNISSVIISTATRIQKEDERQAELARKLAAAQAAASNK